MRKLYKEFQPIGKAWLVELNNYNEVPFQRKTAEVKWSLGEIYEHLGNSTLDFHLKGLEACLLAPKSGKKTWAGKMVFLKNNFQNKKMKAYLEDNYPPKQPENIAEARDKMIRVLKQMDDCSCKITKKTEKQQSEHPILGFLTGKEWYRLVIFHFEYHRKNKDKIDNLLMSSR